MRKATAALATAGLLTFGGMSAAAAQEEDPDLPDNPATDDSDDGDEFDDWGLLGLLGLLGLGGLAGRKRRTDDVSYRTTGTTTGTGSTSRDR